jgi:copper chaperone
MTLQLIVPSLACSSCVNVVTAAVKAVDPDAAIQANTETKLVNVETQASQTAIKKAITVAGYPTA